MVSQDLVSDPPVPPCPPPFLALFVGFWTPRGVPPRDPPRTSFGPKKLNFWGSQAGARRSRRSNPRENGKNWTFFWFWPKNDNFGGFFDPEAANAPFSPPYTPFLSILSISCFFLSGPIPDPDYLETKISIFLDFIDFWGFLTFLTKIIDFGSGPHSRPPVYRSDNRLVSF